VTRWRIAGGGDAHPKLISPVASITHI